MQRSFYISIFVAALLLLGLAFLLHYQNPKFELTPLIIGNLLLAAVSLLSFILINKGINSSNPHAFLRAKYSAMLLKFFICLGAFLGYIFWQGSDQVYQPAIFLLLGMYIVYTALEAIPLSKIARKTK